MKILRVDDFKPKKDNEKTPETSKADLEPTPENSEESKWA